LVHRFNQYVKAVQKGKLTVGGDIQLAVERHIRDTKESTIYKFNPHKAAPYIEFFEHCYHWKGRWANTPIRLEPWQVFYLGSLYGWVDKAGNRRFTSSYLEVARKNSKTTMAALQALAHFILDGVQGAQIYAGATKEEQARIVVNDAGQIARVTPGLRDMIKTYGSDERVTRLVYPKTKSFMRALGRDSKTNDGFDPSMGIIDEYHAHPNDDVRNIIESGMGARAFAPMVFITTAGYNDQGPCKKFRTTAREVLKNTIQMDRRFILIYSLDEDDEYTDPKVWPKPNPNYPVTPNHDYIAGQVDSASKEGGTKEVDVRTKNFNVWTGSASTFIRAEIWKANTHGIKKSSLKGLKCFGGLDLAATSDMNAFVLFFHDYKENVFPILPYFWVPEDRLKDGSENAFFYMQWQKQGHLKTTPGNVIDHGFIYKDIQNLYKTYDIISIGYDPYYAHHGLIQKLTESGAKTTQISQVISRLSAPTKEFERLANSKQFENFGNPIFTWMMGNITLMHNAEDSIKIDKGKSQSKVDGPVALSMAIYQWMEDRFKSKKSPILFVNPKAFKNE